MQRIADHVANGAYFYAKIDWKEYEDWINGETKTILLLGRYEKNDITSSVISFFY